MSEELGIVVGIVFAILGLAILTRLNKLTTHKYYRYLLIVIGIILIGFAIYQVWRSIYVYG
ncbi:hypothetical protein [Aequorivita capsosiphonis]|uniref:hypothetical protein n=1 Tax=Aequorivita capsosiphonis TaxID=487317 RepID=UPI00047DA758|nr:hypothetical protein [Aequorivita capsosiphonis]